MPRYFFTFSGVAGRSFALRATAGNDEAVSIDVHHVAFGIVERERQGGRNGFRRRARTDVVVRPLGDHLLGRGLCAGRARGRRRLACTRRRNKRDQRCDQPVRLRLVGGVERIGVSIGSGFLGVRRRNVVRQPPKGQYVCTRGHVKHDRAHRAVLGRLHDPVDLGRLVLHQRRVQKHGKRRRTKGCGSGRGRNHRARCCRLARRPKPPQSRRRPRRLLRTLAPVSAE